MKHLKNFENFYLITEDPDNIELSNNKIIDIDDGMPFAFDKNKEKVYVGEKGNYHGDDYGTDYSSGSIFPGRIWLDSKIISFWVYPKEKDFKDYINLIEKKLGIKIFNNNWKIEIRLIDNKKNVWNKNQSMYMKNNNFYNEKEILIPIENYIGSEDVPKEQRILHLMNAKEKEKYYKKHGKPKGFGSEKQWKKVKNAKSMFGKKEMTPVEWEYWHKRENKTFKN